MNNPSFLSIDLGTESGLISIGDLQNGILTLTKVYRFNHQPIKLDGGLHWDFSRIILEVKQGLSTVKVPIESLAVTGWSVDYVLLGVDGRVIGMPYSFRDSRSVGMMDEVFKQIPASTIFNYTGVQPFPSNTLFQLYAHKKNREEELQRAVKLLFIPDALNYFLTGEIFSEFTTATTSQMLHRETQTWCMPIVDLVMQPGEVSIERIPLKEKRANRSRMAQVVAPCTRIGILSREVELETGLKDLPVVAGASHDISSAIAAIPAEGEDWAFIILGETTIIGVETMSTIFSGDAMHDNFTNEGGIEGTNLFHKTLAGQALLNNCLHEWYFDSTLSFDRLAEIFEEAAPFTAFIDPDHFTFSRSLSVSETVRGFCLKSGQDIPQSRAQIIRILMESLVLNFRHAFENLKRLTGKNIRRIHVTGTYGENSSLCQLTANALGLQVVSVPTNTVTIGNLLCQAKAMGYLTSLEDIRSVVLHSFNTKTYHPDPNPQAWSKAFTRFNSFKS